MATSTATHSFTLPAVNSAVDEDLWGAQLNTNFTNLDSYLVTRIANYAFAGYELSDALIVDAAAKVYDLGSVSGDIAIDYTNGQTQYGVVSGDVTDISVTNWPASGREGFLTLELTWDGTGGHTFALADSAFKTTGNGDPLQLATGAGDMNELYLRTRDGGAVIKIDANVDYA